MKFVLVPAWLLLAVSLRADQYEDLFQKAALHTQNGQYQQAVQDYKAALALRPGAPEAINNLAVVYYQLHRYTEAFDAAAKIWKLHPELRSAFLIAGMSAVQCNRPREAIPPLQALLANDASNRDALLALASAHFALNEFDEAIAVYERAVNYSQDDATAWYGLAICYERRAEDASAKLARMPGGGAYSKLMLAHYLQGIGDNKLAAEAFGGSELDSSVGSPEAKAEYDLARTLAAKSQQAFERFISLSPQSWQAALFLGDAARQQGDLPSALTHYQDALAKQPDSAGSLLGLGTVYWELGQFDQANTYLRQTLRANPHAVQAVFELANIAVRRHEDATAIPLLKQYLAGQPDALAARADLGRAYLHLHQYESAIVELKKAAASDESGEIHYQLSLALRKSGKNAESDAALEESKALRNAQLEKQRQRHEAP